MFKMIDTDNSGQITFEELKVGLERVGAKLTESEIVALMQAVSCIVIIIEFIVEGFLWLSFTFTLHLSVKSTKISNCYFTIYNTNLDRDFYGEGKNM